MHPLLSSFNVHEVSIRLLATSLNMRSQHAMVVEWKVGKHQGLLTLPAQSTLNPPTTDLLLSKQYISLCFKIAVLKVCSGDLWESPRPF